MKNLLYFFSFGIMIWALIEQTKDKPNINIQIIAVVVFFFLMMRIMNKTPGKSEEQQNKEQDEA